MEMNLEAWFLGTFDGSLYEGNRVTIPIKFSRAVRKGGGGENPLLVVYPTADRSVAFVPVSAETHKPNIWQRELRWDDTINQILQQIRVRPCKPWFRRDELSKPVRAASETLLNESKVHEKVLRQLSGRQFEQLVEDVLISEGVNVQSRISLLGAEIDLLLATYNDESGPQFVILECKNKSVSGKVVGISEVLRLYGLADALTRMGVEVKGRVVVTSTSFSRVAFDFSRIYHVGLVQINELREWVDRSGITPNSETHPFFEVRLLDSRGRIRLPTALLNLLNVDVERRVLAVGVGDRFELWCRGTWKEYTKYTTKYTKLNPLEERREILIGV